MFEPPNKGLRVPPKKGVRVPPNRPILQPPNRGGLLEPPKKGLLEPPKKGVVEGPHKGVAKIPQDAYRSALVSIFDPQLHQSHARKMLLLLNTYLSAVLPTLAVLEISKT